MGSVWKQERTPATVFADVDLIEMKLLVARAINRCRRFHYGLRNGGK